MYTMCCFHYHCYHTLCHHYCLICGTSQPLLCW